MNLRITDLKSKEVINTKDGERLGILSDVEINIESGQISAIIVYGRFKLFGVLGRDDDIIIPWKEIEVIGEETILVKHDISYYKPKRKNSFLKGLEFD